MTVRLGVARWSLAFAFGAHGAAEPDPDPDQRMTGDWHPTNQSV
jgi:hypothetical protein